MQRGTICRHHGSWCLRYYGTVPKDGRPVRKKVFRRLAPVNQDYPNARSVILLADRVLAPINAGQLQPESSMTLVDFIDNIFLPHVERNLKPATYKNYKKDLYERHLKQLFGKIKLRDFRTVTGQRMLRLIPPPKVGNSASGRTTLLRAKAFMSSVFKHAKREGFLGGENPMRDVSVPGKPTKKKQAIYTMEEIEKIVNCVAKVDDRAAVVISVAALRD